MPAHVDMDKGVVGPDSSVLEYVYLFRIFGELLWGHALDADVCGLALNVLGVGDAADRLVVLWAS